MITEIYNKFATKAVQQIAKKLGAPNVISPDYHGHGEDERSSVDDFEF